MTKTLFSLSPKIYIFLTSFFNPILHLRKLHHCKVGTLFQIESEDINSLRWDDETKMLFVNVVWILIAVHRLPSHPRSFSLAVATGTSAIQLCLIQMTFEKTSFGISSILFSSPILLLAECVCVGSFFSFFGICHRRRHDIVGELLE